MLLHIMKKLAASVRERRKEVNLTQQESEDRAGVALTVFTKIEQGKTNLNLDKVNLVLKMFGHKLMTITLKQLKDNEKS